MSVHNLNFLTHTNVKANTLQTNEILNNLDVIQNVNLTNVQDDDILKYSSGNWINGTQSGGGAITGNYVPTTSSLSNVNNLIIYNAWYIQNDKIVNVFINGEISFSSTSPTEVHMELSLPIEPEDVWLFSGPLQGQMTIHHQTNEQIVSPSITSNKNAHIQFNPSVTGNGYFSLNICYRTDNPIGPRI